MAPASSMAQAESVSATPPTDLAFSADQAGGGGVKTNYTNDAEAGGSDGSIKAPWDDSVSTVPPQSSLKDVGGTQTPRGDIVSGAAPTTSAAFATTSEKFLSMAVATGPPSAFSGSLAGVIGGAALPVTGPPPSLLLLSPQELCAADAAAGSGEVVATPPPPPPRLPPPPPPPHLPVLTKGNSSSSGVGTGSPVEGSAGRKGSAEEEATAAAAASRAYTEWSMSQVTGATLCDAGVEAAPSAADVGAGTCASFAETSSAKFADGDCGGGLPDKGADVGSDVGDAGVELKPEGHGADREIDPEDDREGKTHVKIDLDGTVGSTCACDSELGGGKSGELGDCGKGIAGLIADPEPEAVLQGLALPIGHGFAGKSSGGEGGDDDGECENKAGQPTEEERQARKLRMQGEQELPRLLVRYGGCVEKCPCCFLVLYLVLIILTVGIFWRPIQLDDDLSAFARSDGQALRNRDAYDLAVLAMPELEAKGMAAAPFGSGDGRRLSRPTAPLRQLAASDEYLTKAFAVYYVLKDGGSMLDERALREARDFEAKLRRLPAWSQFCSGRSDATYQHWLCDPGESMVTFAWPEQVHLADGSGFELHFSGNGTEMLAAPVLLQYLDDWKGARFDEPAADAGSLTRYFPRDYVDGTGTKAPRSEPPQSLRSRFTFSLVYGDSSMASDQLSTRMNKASEEFDAFIQKEVYPALATASKETKYVEVFYSGDGINKYEVSLAMQTDIMWALGSILFVTLYMGVYVCSMPAMFGSFFVIFASVPLAYVCTPAAKTTFASLMSLFLITVIDVDIIFIFYDFWAQSVHLGKVDRRLAWMLVKAGKSCLATSLTTSLSFFANLLSSMQPLREFGMFMGLCVTNVFVLALLFLPPILVIRLRRQQRSESRRIVPVTQKDSRQSEDEEAKWAETLKLEAPDASQHRSQRAHSKESEGSKGSNGSKGSKDSKGSGRSFADRQARMAARARRDQCMNVMLSRLVDCTSTCPCMILLTTLALAIVGILGIIKTIELETGPPVIFKPDSNQVRGKEISGGFGSVLGLAAPGSAKPTLRATACEASGFYSTKRNCRMHWCEGVDQEAYDDGRGQCWRGNVTKVVDGTEFTQWDTEGCGQVKVTTRVASKALADNSDYLAFITQWEALVLNLINGTANTVNPLRTKSSIRPLILEEWQTGTVLNMPYWELAPIRAYDELRGQIDPVCHVNAICFAGPHRCALPDWRLAGVFDDVGALAAANATAVVATSPTTSPTPPPVSGLRRLGWIAQGDVPEDRQIRVEVVFGLWAPDRTPLVGPTPVPWRFDPMFEPDDPWAQRAMLRLCHNLTEDLKVTWSDCWIETFKQALPLAGQRFPSRNVHEDVVRWRRSSGDQSQIWIVDGKMRAASFGFWCDINNRVSADKLLKYKEKWDLYLELRNSEASLTASRAYHSSQVWVGSEAAVAVVESTLETILLACTVSWLGVWLFTGDPVLATIVLCTMLANTIGLTFFMTVIMSWKIGAIEIIFLVVFLGYSVTFGLHMAYNYSAIGADDPEMLRVQIWARHRRALRGRTGVDASTPASQNSMDTLDLAAEPLLVGRELRKARTRTAVLRIGAAVLASTFSTIGSSMFLLVCALNIFIRLGFVIVATVALSLVSTMFVLPAVLVLIGPPPDPCYKRRPRQAILALLGRGRRPKGGKEEPLLDDQDAKAPL